MYRQVDFNSMFRESSFGVIIGIAGVAVFVRVSVFVGVEVGGLNCNGGGTSGPGFGPGGAGTVPSVVFVAYVTTLNPEDGIGPLAGVKVSIVASLAPTNLTMPCASIHSRFGRLPELLIKILPLRMPRQYSEISPVLVKSRVNLGQPVGNGTVTGETHFVDQPVIGE